jgi:aspartate-semialdehyde dehydrogenase
MPERPVVAVAGATGAVGREMLLALEQRRFPAREVRALASSRSAGKVVPFAGGQLTVEEMTLESFAGVDIALFSAGAGVSKRFRDAVVGAGCVMIDNSSAFRMEEGVPLVVPEVNGAEAAKHEGVIANPNCSTIQMVVALKPLHDIAPIKRVVVATYQAASGAGQAAMDELYEQTRQFLAGDELSVEQFAHRIAFNCIPHIDVFLEDGSTKEEWKMVVETKKIMHAPEIEVAATCVRVPVLRCHSEALTVEFANPIDLDRARAALSSAPGIVVLDDTSSATYPMPAMLEGSDDTYVGRLRSDPTVPYGISMWVVADQLRKGAALNAVQIAEELLGNQPGEQHAAQAAVDESEGPMNDSAKDAKILVVEDDSTIGRFVELELQHAGYEVFRFGDGESALGALDELSPDIVLLDLMLPGIDGLEVARTIRERRLNMPILMLTARSETQDVVTGFEAGADDYLRKPFEIPELLSRVGALLKRTEHERPAAQYKIGDVEIDPASRSVHVAGELVNFTAKEYDLLEFLVANAGRVISRDEILQTVWGGQHTTDSNVIEVFVCHLRGKIGDTDNQIIRTIRGVGYFYSRT